MVAFNVSVIVFVGVGLWLQWVAFLTYNDLASYRKLWNEPVYGELADVVLVCLSVVFWLAGTALVIAYAELFLTILGVGVGS